MIGRGGAENWSSEGVAWGGDQSHDESLSRAKTATMRGGHVADACRRAGLAVAGPRFSPVQMALGMFLAARGVVNSELPSCKLASALTCHEVSHVLCRSFPRAFRGFLALSVRCMKMPRAAALPRCSPRCLCCLVSQHNAAHYRPAHGLEINDYRKGVSAHGSLLSGIMQAALIVSITLMDMLFFCFFLLDTSTNYVRKIFPYDVSNS